ncbi:T9SS type A sorting domain-containing protein [Aequorivita lipolytica]|uniref:T9SS type A sorting domain-containing protein n=1 Tax=Aequorivita lipolytica TaxID=153267 RepID=A0A5C6YU09_9FLAO|nr:T9SS type A sorting domain-containing protein [Aequorivita lipolytica]TXD70759.1 T9SS type A sorting domain-containing protein [Aequorivita lipolytica]SRX49802.1 hypothetical protein AEQU2_00267 [Aequorivita lipolytica]
MKKIIFFSVLSISLFAQNIWAQDFQNNFRSVASHAYVQNSFGEYGTVPLAGPYYPPDNVISTNTFTMLGGDFNDEDVLYVIVYIDPDYLLGIVELNTGTVNYAATLSGVVAPQFLSQLSYNFTNDTYYVLSHDPNNNTGTQFYSLNINTGVLTPIGSGTGLANGVAMEIDNNGIVYAADANTGNLYTIDINTGLGTVLGNMSPNGFYPVQSGLSVDRSTNVMYASLPYRNGVIWNQYYTVDLATGTLTHLGQGLSRRNNLFAIASDNLGINDTSLNRLSVYPNPASSVIHIYNPNGIVLKTAKLYDVLGRDTGATLENSEMNIENLTKGMYMLQLETENGATTRKIVKE